MGSVLTLVSRSLGSEQASSSRKLQTLFFSIEFDYDDIVIISAVCCAINNCSWIQRRRLRIHGVHARTFLAPVHREERNNKSDTLAM